MRSMIRHHQRDERGLSALNLGVEIAAGER
jgi:hypothetical protein